MSLRLLLVTLVAMAAGSAHAQQAPLWDVSLETGWNAPNATGIAVGRRVTPEIEVFVGGGLGAAGYRLALNGRYFFSTSEDAGFVGVGYAFATGTLGQAVPLQVTDVNGRMMTHAYELTAGHLLNLVVGHRWGFASGRGHFVVLGGYSSRLSGGRFVAVEPAPKLDPASTLALNIVSPGGLVLAVDLGFSF